MAMREVFYIFTFHYFKVGSYKPTTVKIGYNKQLGTGQLVCYNEIDVNALVNVVNMNLGLKKGKIMFVSTRSLL
jgi:hypothetical protein